MVRIHRQDAALLQIIQDIITDEATINVITSSYISNTVNIFTSFVYTFSILNVHPYWSSKLVRPTAEACRNEFKRFWTSHGHILTLQDQIFIGWMSFQQCWSTYKGSSIFRQFLSIIVNVNQINNEKLSKQFQKQYATRVPKEKLSK